MFLLRKPVRFGSMIRSHCGTDGYSYPLNIYTGRDRDASTEPLDSRVVKKMVHMITTNSETIRHIIATLNMFFDNFFTNYDLLKNLASMSMKKVRTVRENRTLVAKKV